MLCIYKCFTHLVKVSLQALYSASDFRSVFFHSVCFGMENRENRKKNHMMFSSNSSMSLILSVCFLKPENHSCYRSVVIMSALIYISHVTWVEKLYLVNPGLSQTSRVC